MPALTGSTTESTPAFWLKNTAGEEQACTPSVNARRIRNTISVSEITVLEETYNITGIFESLLYIKNKGFLPEYGKPGYAI